MTSASSVSSDTERLGIERDRQPAMILSANQNALGAAKEWKPFLNDN